MALAVGDPMTLPRVGFVTAVEIGAACIDTIAEMGGRLELVVTLSETTAPRKSGRVDVAAVAREHEFPLMTVAHINDAAPLEAIRESGLDWLFVVGWSQIVGPKVLATPQHGAIGAHPTLLPAGRGRAPIPWTILRGLDESGVTFFVLDEGVDSGPIIAQDRFSIAADETATTLYAKVIASHRRMMRTVWPMVVAENVQRQPQNEALATYWAKRNPEDGEIHSTITVAEADRLVRATTRPYPGAFVQTPTGRTTIWAGQMERPPLATRSLVVELVDGKFWGTDFETREPG